MKATKEGEEAIAGVSTEGTASCACATMSQGSMALVYGRFMLLALPAFGSEVAP